MEVKSESEVAQSCLTLHDPRDCSLQAPLSMGFSRQEYWSGVPLQEHPIPQHQNTADHTLYEQNAVELENNSLEVLNVLLYS